MLKTSNEFKNTFSSYLLSSVSIAVIGFLTTVFTTRNISLKEYGELGIFLSFFYILPSILSFSSVGLVAINKVNLSKEEFQNFINSFLTFSIVLFVIVFSLSLTILFYSTEFLFLTLLLSAISIVRVFSEFHNTILIQNSNSKEYAIYNLANSIMSLLLTVAFIMLFLLESEGRILAMLVAEIVVLYFRYKKTAEMKLYTFTLDKNSIKQIINYGWPLMIALFAGWLLNNSDRYIILKFLSLKDVAYYTLAFTIGMIINIINQAFSNAYVPMLYRKLKQKKAYDMINKMTLPYTLTLLAISLFIGASSYWYVPLVFGKEYASSSDIIFFISLAFGVNGLSRVVGSVIDYYKLTKLKMVLLYLSAVLNIIISILLIPRFGINAPTIGTLVSYIALTIATYYFSMNTLIKEENIGKNIIKVS